MILEFPSALLAVVLLIPLVFIMRRSARRTREAAELFHGESPARLWFSVRLALACIFLAALAAVAARPQLDFGRSADILFVVDVSRSMHARFSCSEPTFLARAKDVLRETVDGIPEARFGIVAFDRFAFPVSQLTTDRSYFEQVIEGGLYVGLMLEATQTEIANALAVVATKKARLPDLYGNVNHVVLLSDGHVQGDFRRRLQAPLTELQNHGVRVSTIGIGNPVATPIVDNRNARCINEHIEVDGGTVLVPLRADVLKYVAAESGGHYYTESQTPELIAMLRSELGSERIAGAGSDELRRDMSTFFLAIATVALLLYLYLPVRMSRQSRPFYRVTTK